MSKLDDLISCLGSDKLGRYPKEIPCPRDDDVRALVAAISQAEEAARKEIISKLVKRHGWTFLAFGERMGVLAVRTGQSTYIQESLIALSLAWGLLYWKEVLPVLTLVYHSTQKIGLEPRQFLEANATTLPNENFRQALLDCLHSDQKNWSLETMLYVESEDKDGFLYKRTW